FDVKVLPLRGRGVAPIAYEMPWTDKTVLFSGRIPLKLNQPALEGLLTDFKEGRGDRSDYSASLKELADVKPDVWLPAVPADGQNANLYDGDWKDVIGSNRKLIE